MLLLFIAGPGWTAPAENKLQVIIQGLDGRLQENVAANLEINQLAGQPLPPESRLPWLHARAEENIRQALQPFGYYNPVIDASLQRTAAGWEARYQITPGPPVIIRKVDIEILGEGADDPAFQEAVRNFPLAPGKTLDEVPYEQLKTTLRILATERGYFDAQLLTHQIQVNPQTNQADIILRFAAGPRYRFGATTFHQDILEPALLNRYLDFKPGQPYLASALSRLQSDLLGSNYFSRVEVNASPDNAQDHTIPVDVTLEPRKPRQYTFSLGYGTDTGPRGRVGVENFRVNRWGHRYRAAIQASQIQYGVAGEYSIPGANPSTDTYAVYGSYLDEQIPNTKDSQSLSIGAKKQWQDGLWQKTVALDFGQENYLDYSSSPEGEDRSSILLIPNLHWSWVNAGNRLNVADGARLDLKLRGAYDPLLSDVSFLQPAAYAKWIHTFAERHRLLARASAGGTWVSDFDHLPTSLRFYAGGDNSVRGYRLDSIGPENAAGKVTGGKYLAVGSLEYDYLFRDKWAVAAFADTGDAFNDSLSLKSGVGVGLRWLSPVGPIRLDVASGLDRPPGSQIRLHFNIGPEL